MCKDSRSCTLLLPGSHTGRAHDIYLFSTGPMHSAAPKDKWIVVASARVEGDTDGLSAMEAQRPPRSHRRD